MFRNKEWLRVSGTAQLRALDVSVLFASSLFLSWFLLTVLAPTLFRPFPASAGLHAAYRVTVLIVGAAVFAAAAVRPDFANKLLDRRRYEIAAVFAAALAGMAATVGAWMGSLPVVLACAAVVGLTFPYFLLEWCRMYSRRGARTSMPLIAGALAASFGIDLLALALSPLVRALFASSLTIVVILVLFGVQRLTQTEPDPGFAHAAIPVAIGATLADPDDEAQAARKTRLPFPVPLFVASGLLGTTAGLALPHLALVPVPAWGAIVAAAVAAGIAFLLCCFATRIALDVLWAYLMAGVVGFLVEMQSGAHDAFLLCVAVGFIGAITLFFGLLGHYAFFQGETTTHAFAPNLAVAFGSFAAGLFLAAAFDVPFPLAATCLYVLGAFGLVVSTGTPLPLFDAPLAVEEAAQASAPAEVAARIAKSHNLTERERDILELLIIGRSRPRIAQILTVSENTVNSHIQHMYRKLDVHSFQELLDFIYADG